MKNTWFFVNTRENEKGQMFLDVFVHNWEQKDGEIKIKLVDEKKDLEIRTVLAEKEGCTYSFICEEVELWNPENPYLYHLDIEISSVHGTSISYDTKVGFRVLERKGKEVFWNHQSLKLKGVCYRENVLDWENTKKDLELFAKANINYIRGIYGPFSEQFLSLCDEMGFFVENTAPYYEIGTERLAIQDLPHEKERFIDAAYHLLENGNHVSILLWSLGHDCSWGTNFSAAAKIIKSVDPIRLLTFHLPMSVPEEDFYLDVWPVHYQDWKLPLDVCYDQMVIFHTPGCDNEIGYMTAEANYDVPVLHDIWAPVPCHNRDEIQKCSGIHSFWGESIERFAKKSEETPGCLGGAVLAGVDEDGSFEDMGEYRWGILDRNHMPKPEYFCLQKAYAGKNKNLNPTKEENASYEREGRKIQENKKNTDFSVKKEIRESEEKYIVSNQQLEYCFSVKTCLLESAYLNGKLILAGGPYMNTEGYLLGAWHGTYISAENSDKGVQVIISGTYEDSLDVRFILDLTPEGVIHTAYEILKVYRHLPHTVKAGIGVAVGTLNEKGAAYLLPNVINENMTMHQPKDMYIHMENGCNIKIFSDGAESIKFEKAPQFTPNAVVNDRDERVYYYGNWCQMADYCGNYLGTETLSNSLNDWFEIAFTGTGINLYAPMDMNQGSCDVYVDGNKVAENVSQFLDRVDFPGLSRGYEKRYGQKFFEIHELEEKEHIVRVVVKGEKVRNSQNTYISFDYAVLEGASYPAGTLLKINQDYNYNRLVRGCYVRPKVRLIAGEVGDFTIGIQDIEE